MMKLDDKSRLLLLNNSSKPGELDPVANYPDTAIDTHEWALITKPRDNGNLDIHIWAF